MPFHPASKLLKRHFAGCLETSSESSSRSLGRTEASLSRANGWRLSGAGRVLGEIRRARGARCSRLLAQRAIKPCSTAAFAGGTQVPAAGRCLHRGGGVSGLP